MCGLVHTCRYFDPARGDVFSASWREARRRREEDGDPGMTRTSDLRFRKPPLYPAELRDREPAHSRAATGSPASRELWRRRPMPLSFGFASTTTTLLLRPPMHSICEAVHRSCFYPTCKKAAPWPKEPLKSEGPKKQASTSVRRRASEQGWTAGSPAPAGERSPVTDG